VVEYILRLHKVLGLIPCTENKSVLFVAMLTHYSLPAIGRLRQEDHKIKACLGEELISLEVFSACSTVPDGHLQLGVFTSLPVFMLLHFCLYPPPSPILLSLQYSNVPFLLVLVHFLLSFLSLDIKFHLF
jgi:hypothetical protein